MMEKISYKKAKRDTEKKENLYLVIHSVCVYNHLCCGLNCISQNSNIEVLTTLECDLNGKQDYCRCVNNQLNEDKIILEWAGSLIQYDWCPYKKDLETDKQRRGNDMKRQAHRKKTAMHKPRREVQKKTFPHNPQKEPSLLTSSFQTFSLQNCETTNASCLSPTSTPVLGPLLHQLQQTNTMTTCMTDIDQVMLQ